MEGFITKLIFALEKIAALLTSQRTLATAAGVVVIAGMMWGVITPLVGLEAGELPDEAQLEAYIGQWAVVLATAITGLVAVLQLVKALVVGMNDRPPTLQREDYLSTRKQ